MRSGGEMRREHAFYGSFCRLLEFHLKRLGLSAAAFAAKAGRSQQGIHSYLAGRLRPPLDQVPIWAAMLGLHGEERDRFLLAAQEPHMPLASWRRLQELERGVKADPPSPLQDHLTLCRGVVAELVQLLRELEALFFTRSLPVDRIAAERAKLQTATRRAVERYAKPGVES